MNKIGVIGLAVMGTNLARNFASRGVETAVYNRTYQRTKNLLDQHAAEYVQDGIPKLTGYEKLEDFVNSLEKPRRIILMVQAGSPVDEVLGQLHHLLEKGDYVIDGGNSFYEDTERRYLEMKDKAVNFLGMGISGGEEGALKGPSLMPGLTKDDWPFFENILGKIAAKDFEGKPCVTPIGPGGAGHYVKMVHNGIEYAIMQLIAEIYDFNRKTKGLSAQEIGKIFDKISDDSASSFLTEVTGAVLSHVDKESGRAMVDVILDKAAQKGTGGWTSIESIKLGAAAEMIGEAVAARSISSFKELREKISAQREQAAMRSEENINWNLLLYFGMLMAYSQGLFLIKMASEARGWGVNLEEVCRIWQGGCIIRSRMLLEIGKALQRNPQMSHLMEDAELFNRAKADWGEILKFITESARSGVAVPVAASAFNYYLAISDKNSPANLIQGMRDFFGAHTFERVDKTGVFHEKWY